MITATEHQQLVLLDWVFAVSGTKSYVKQAVTRREASQAPGQNFHRMEPGWDLKLL